MMNAGHKRPPQPTSILHLSRSLCKVAIHQLPSSKTPAMPLISVASMVPSTPALTSGLHLARSLAYSIPVGTSTQLISVKLMNLIAATDWTSAVALFPSQPYLLSLSNSILPTIGAETMER